MAEGNAAHEDVDWAGVMGFDRLPEHIIGKRVTDLMDLTGKKAVVTGSGGDGLGQAIANRLAGSGADVAVVDLNFEGAQATAQVIEQRWGTRAIPLHADISDWDAVHAVAAEAEEKLGGLDIWVNNPVLVRGGAFETHTKEDVDYTVQHSLSNLLYGCHAAVEHLVPRGSGTIINVASVGGRTAQRGISVYNACKSGVIGFTRNLAHEVAPKGVRVLGVAPGIMLNEGLKKIVVNAETDQERAGRDAMRESITDKVQLGRASLPEEVANMAAFLASDAASYMVGQTIDVAGGQVMD